MHVILSTLFMFILTRLLWSRLCLSSSNKDNDHEREIVCPLFIWGVSLEINILVSSILITASCHAHDIILMHTFSNSGGVLFFLLNIFFLKC